LLHDIGKTQIPQDVINKTGKLTPKEMELVKLHATYSYRLLNDLPNIPPTVKSQIGSTQKSSILLQLQKNWQKICILN
ncbi:MAG: rpfG 14, partial [Anaerospora sp.]|nr:rpfG 14 [Anaerospora sp.]